jgi:hypothetical protein
MEGGLMGGHIWHLNFVTGEARQITEAEHRQMVVEMQKRTKVKDGVLYIDCEPPPDPQREEG